MKLSTLIIDDEPLAITRMRQLIREEASLEIVGECSDGLEALNAIKTLSPDLIFLDIKMPEMDGFEVLKSLPEDRLPSVIFTTAYDQHAIRAFETHALDYLLKPIQESRFKSAVTRAVELFESQKASEEARRLLSFISENGHQEESNRYLKRLTIRNLEKVSVLKTTDIDYVESAGNYVAVHIGKESHIMRDSLQSLEKQLDPGKFLRISRSAIVNLDRVKELQPMFKGESVVILDSGAQLPVTRGIREFEKALRFS